MNKSLENREKRKSAIEKLISTTDEKKKTTKKKRKPGRPKVEKRKIQVCITVDEKEWLEFTEVCNMRKSNCSATINRYIRMTANKQRRGLGQYRQNSESEEDNED